MKKFIRVFSSQLFNAFFPILIIIILISLAGRSGVAQIFLLLNYANIYLLFSDYSANIRFLKEAVLLGGIKSKEVALPVIDYIHAYLGIKIIILGVGFVAWAVLCVCVPLLSEHLLASLFSYSFIVGYTLSFYWVYIVSNNEYFFIMSNFVSRLLLICMLLLFIWLKVNFTWLMPIVGAGSFITNVFFFQRFCKKFSIPIVINKNSLKKSASIIKSDFPLVANSFLLMAPSILVSIFIGYVKNAAEVIIYALAEKIFAGFRTLLAVFVNSIYPVFCESIALKSTKARKIFIGFFASIFLICGTVFFVTPYLIPYFHLPSGKDLLFLKCLSWFLLSILTISINVPLMLWLLVRNEINSHKTTVVLLIAVAIIFSVFLIQAVNHNTVVSVVQSLLVGEAMVAISFVFLFIVRKPNLAFRKAIQKGKAKMLPG